MLLCDAGQFHEDIFKYVDQRADPLDAGAAGRNEYGKWHMFRRIAWQHLLYGTGFQKIIDQPDMGRSDTSSLYQGFPRSKTVID